MGKGRDKRRKAKARKLTAERRAAVDRKTANLNPGYNATDVDAEGRPWWQGLGHRTTVETR